MLIINDTINKAIEYSNRWTGYLACQIYSFLNPA